MNEERAERIETKRYHVEIDNQEGKGGEDVIEYADGLYATGEFTEGPSKGHKWMRGEGGSVDAAPERVTIAGLSDMPVTEFRAGRYGVIRAQGEDPKKPKTGETYFWGHTTTEQEFAQTHPNEELVLREDAEEEVDEQNRPTYKVGHGSNGKVMVLRTTYYDGEGEGYFVRTGKHLEGPEKGKVWEERRSTTPENEQAIPSIMATPHGNIHWLVIRGFSRTIRGSDQEIADEKVTDAKALHLVMRGEWEPNAEA